MKFKLTLTILFTIAFLKASACSCGMFPMSWHYQQASFVATIKILTLEQDSVDKNIHNADIEILDLYKGQHVDKIKILTETNRGSSCAFLPEIGNTFVVFGWVWNKKEVMFGFCNNIKLNQQSKPSEYANEGANYGSVMNLNLDALKFLGTKKLVNLNPSKIANTFFFVDTKMKLESKTGFAVYKLKVNQDYSIDKVKSIKRFKNNTLHKMSMKEIAKKKLTGPPLTKPTELIIILHNYNIKGFTMAMDII